MSLVVVFNLTNGASLSARQKTLKQKDMIADTREFPEMEFSEQEKEVIRMLKNQNLLNSLRMSNFHCYENFLLLPIQF